VSASRGCLATVTDKDNRRTDPEFQPFVRGGNASLTDRDDRTRSLIVFIDGFLSLK
jgi:hypothetical protein